MKLIIFRHGQTDATKEKVLHSRTDTLLNEEGALQAKNLGEMLIASGVRFSAVFASPLHRALKTAEIVAEPHNIEVLIRDELIEANLGEAEHVSYDEFFSKYHGAYHLPEDVGEEHPDFYDSKIPGGESRREVLERWNTFIDSIKGLPLEVVGVGTHYCVMFALYYHYFKKHPWEFKNCDYFEVEI